MGLTVKRVKSLLANGAVGKHGDRDGLYLIVNGVAAAHWSHRYQHQHSPHWMGLGRAAAFTLDEARELNRKVLQERASGIDPLTAKRARRQAVAAAANAAAQVGDVPRHGRAVHHGQSGELEFGAARPAVAALAGALRLPADRRPRRQFD